MAQVFRDFEGMPFLQRFKATSSFTHLYRYVRLASGKLEDGEEVDCTKTTLSPVKRDP